MGSLQQKDAAWNGERRLPSLPHHSRTPTGRRGLLTTAGLGPEPAPSSPTSILKPRSASAAPTRPLPAPLSPQPRSRLLTASPQPGRAQQRRPQPQQRHAAPLRRHAAPPALTAQARRAACRER